MLLQGVHGRVDMMWFDHVGGRDWGKWKFDGLFAMIYRHQPGMLVNDRTAKFCGPQSPEELELSSGSPHDNVGDHERLFKGEKPGRGFAFHTGDEQNPWAKIDSL
jgi:alpha-L-fucosidase